MWPMVFSFCLANFFSVIRLVILCGASVSSLLQQLKLIILSGITSLKKKSYLMYFLRLKMKSSFLITSFIQ